MRTETIWLTAKDSQRIHMKVFTPDADPVGCIAMVHGFGEHTGRYGRVARFFCDRGYVFALHDQRGHGETPGKRGLAPSYDALISDIDLVLAWIRENHPNLPIALYGHSMGGNEVLYRILYGTPPTSVRCAVAGSPWLRLHSPPPAATLAMARIVSKILPKFTAKSQLSIDDLTRSETVRAETRADPAYHYQIGARLFGEISENGERILADAGKVRIPLFVMVGTEDRVVSREAVEEFIARCGEHCESRIWPGFYHELHNEPEAEEVLSAVSAFLERWMKSPGGGK